MVYEIKIQSQDNVYIFIEKTQFKRKIKTTNKQTNKHKYAYKHTSLFL